MAFEIPIPSNQAKFSMSVTMDSVVYRMTFTWNTRVQAWYMVFAAQDGTPILSGIKILPNISLLQRHKDVRLPKGVLFTFDEQGGDDAPRPGKGSLGTTLKLYYIPEDEYEAL